MFQLPNLDGSIFNYSSMISDCNDRGVIISAIIDPMWQVLMKPIGEMGIDIAVGSAQRLGIPMGFGGPYAAFFATKEKYKRKVPGRIVGQSVDSEGNIAYRLALQTREQHIRRDKATSNICTSQALLATMSSFYVAYHGPKGLEKIYGKKVKHYLNDDKTRIEGVHIKWSREETCGGHKPGWGHRRRCKVHQYHRSRDR